MGMSTNEVFAFRTCNAPDIRRDHCEPGADVFRRKAFPHTQPLGSVNINVFKRSVECVQ